MLQPRCHRSPERDFKRRCVHPHVWRVVVHTLHARVCVCVLGYLLVCASCICVSLCGAQTVEAEKKPLLLLLLSLSFMQLSTDC